MTGLETNLEPVELAGDGAFDAERARARGVAVPWHLTTRQFVAEVALVLRPRGVYAVNVIDHPAAPVRSSGGGHLLEASQASSTSCGASMAEADLTMAIDGYPTIASLSRDALRPVR